MFSFSETIYNCSSKLIVYFNKSSVIYIKNDFGLTQVTRGQFSVFFYVF